MKTTIIVIVVMQGYSLKEISLPGTPQQVSPVFDSPLHSVEVSCSPNTTS